MRLIPEMNEAAFLQRIFLYAFVLRGAAILLLNAMNLSTVLAEDAGTYHYSGMWVMYHWKYDLQYPEYVARIVSSHWGYAYFIGAIYYVLGEVPLLIQFTSAFFGAYIPLVVYRIAKFLFDDKMVAMKSAKFSAFLPSMIIWSSQILREPLIVLAICLGLYAGLQLMERFRINDFMLLIAALFVLSSVRFYLAYILFGCLIFSFAFGSWFLSRGVGRQLVIGLLLAVLVVSTGLYQSAQERIGNTPLQEIQQTRVGLTDAGSGYAELPDVSTPAGAVSALPRGSVYFFLAPFPWQITSLRSLLTMPEMLLWWALLPVALRGLGRAWRLRKQHCLLIMSFIVVLSLFCILVSGNAGVAFRYRTQIVPLVFIFASFELVVRQRGQITRQQRVTLPQRVW